LTIDEEPSGLHLDAVARQANDALDVVGPHILGQPEDDDVAVLRRLREGAPREQLDVEGNEYRL
jgi:hypothetical protein